MPFTFLLALGVFAVIILFCVDVDKSRIECRAYLEEEARRVYEMPSGAVTASTLPGSLQGETALQHADDKGR